MTRYARSYSTLMRKARAQRWQRWFHSVRTFMTRPARELFFVTQP
jgi:hypothetical protein